MTSLLQHHLRAAASNDELTQKYLLLAQLYEQKQWHQLTNLLEEIIANESGFWYERNMLDLYFDFVSKFETKLNPMRLVQFCTKASKQFFTSSLMGSQEAHEAAVDFMEQIFSKVNKTSTGGGWEAGVVAKMRICQLQIQFGEMDQAKMLLKEFAPKLNMLEGSVFEKQVKSSYYLAQSLLLRQLGPAGEFFQSMLNLFAQKPDISSPEERLNLAVDVAVAALVAEEVFNFGEILQYDLIKQELSTRPSHNWLYNLLVVFNLGDITAFNMQMDQNRQAVLASPTLANSVHILRQKATLLSLVCMAFERPNQERDLTFQDIANYTQIPIDQVEWLIMSAFSKKLLRGWIDGVEEVVHVSWIMPRVLDNAQIVLLAGKLEAWSLNVDVALTYETLVPELFAS
ncbi:hypothetical protein BASA81_005464 [Batrachochytrium salamandrivorans]|nr:hypothetical protein BASA81_005464 [Batrachochytrium salamandrivorans]